MTIDAILEQLDYTLDTCVMQEDPDHFHECFSGPCIPYVDFDEVGEGNRDESLARLKSAIEETFPEGRVIYADRSGFSAKKQCHKISLRAYIREAGWFPNPPSVWEFLKDTPIGQLAEVDSECYKSRQNMGLCWNTKMGDSRVLKILSPDGVPLEWDPSLADQFKDTLIQCISPLDGKALCEDTPQVASVSIENAGSIIDSIELAVQKLMPGVSVIRAKMNGEITLLELNKSSDECPIHKYVHKANRNYIICAEDKTWLKCHKDSTLSMPLVEILSDIKSMLPAEVESDDEDEPVEDVVEFTPVGDAERLLLRSDHMDSDYSEYFSTKYSGQFIVFDGRLFHFADGSHTWTCVDEGILHKFLANQLYRNLRAVLDDLYRDIEDAKKHADTAKKLLKLRNWQSRKGIVLEIKGTAQVSEDPFDMNASLVGFKNGIYNLDTCKFRAGIPADFVSKSTGYNYMPADSAKMAVLKNFINEIMPRADEREYLLRALSSGLYGKTCQNIFILTGAGGNGKDTLVSKLYRDTLGHGYYEYSNTTILTDKRKGDLCQGIANMNKKRGIVWSEPPKSSILQGAIIKEITGVNILNARGLYSTCTTTHIMASCFLLCNDIPKVDSIDGGLSRRLNVIPFRSLFKKPEEIALMSSTTDVYPINGYYDSSEFREAHKMELFHLLTEYFAVFKTDGYMMLNVPKSIQDMSAEYLQGSDDFLSWFLSVYEKGDAEEYISIKDVWMKFQGSEFCRNLNKTDKRLMNKGKLILDIAKNPTLRGFYKDLHRPYVNGKQKKHRNVLMGYRLKPDEVESEAEDEE
jgi:phage/plasmid-associated DNA primase